MRAGILRLGLASLFLVLSPAAALADSVQIGPCGSVVIVGNAGGNLGTLGECLLAGGGTALHGGRVILGENQFLNHHSPVFVTSESGQNNVFVMTITTNPNWTIADPVLTRLALAATIEILEPGATVDIVFTGLLGGPPLVIQQHFASSGNFSVEIFGMQAINSVATSTLSVTINGAATFFAAGLDRQFEGTAIPEPTSLLLLGAGLTGVAMKLRKRRRVEKKEES